MSSELQIPKIETYLYKNVLFRIAVLSGYVVWNTCVDGRLYCGGNYTVIAAKNRAKLEIDRAIKRYECREDQRTSSESSA